MTTHIPDNLPGKVSSRPFPLDLRRYQVIATSEGEGEGHWTGGCSSLKDRDGMIYLAYRVRNPEQRGCKLCIASSEDGINFTMVKYMFKHGFGSFDSLERPCLLQDPQTGRYKLYLCLDKKEEWSIYKLEDTDSPSLFDPATARRVLSPSSENEDSRKVKDPYIINFAELWYMFYSGMPMRAMYRQYLFLHPCLQVSEELLPVLYPLITQKIQFLTLSLRWRRFLQRKVSRLLQ